PNILLGIDSLRAGSGGVSRVARLMARVLGELHESGDALCSPLAYKDHGLADNLLNSVQCSRGSKARFAMMAVRQGLHATHCIYDAASMAQVHRLPMLRRKPSLLFIHGIEVWEQARP